MAAPEWAAADEEIPDSPHWRERVPAVLLALLGLAWTAMVVWSTATATPAGRLPAAEILARVAVWSAPLALLLLIHLLVRGGSRREARRFARTAAATRQEAAWLGEVLATLSTRIEENRRALGDHAHQLLLVGDDATARLGEISGAMRAETNELARQSDRLEQAARGARSDIATLLEDLPRATSESRDLAVLLRDAGTGAQEQAAALDTALVSLTERSRAAEEGAGGAAQRLTAQVARIETSATLAAERLDATAAGMSSTVEATLAEAARAVDETRRAIDAQSAAMLAMVEQGRVAIDHAGTDAARALSDRLGQIGSRLDTLAAGLAAQGQAGEKLVEDLGTGFDGIERRLVSLDSKSVALGDTMVTLGARAALVEGSLERGGTTVEALAGRIDDFQRRLGESGAILDQSLPALLDELDQRIARSRAAIEATAPKVTEMTAASGQAVVRLGQADTILSRQTATIRAVGLAAEERLAAIQEHASALEAALSGSGEQVRQLVDAAGPQLIEALLRVRETARNAADHAREAFAHVIPEAAGTLAAAATAALRGAVEENVEARLDEIAAASEGAVDAAQRASERLTRQMLTIADTTALIESRLAEARSEMAEADEDAFARRVAQLIDALNSTAINVTGILSQEVADSAWAAYLKGDRGVFTRRAVRLLEASEVREIQRLYDADAGFREQLNRYVHDFEAMLRRVLASRDGSPLGVALLSSDMGKLYVALAQAIDRLRA